MEVSLLEVGWRRSDGALLKCATAKEKPTATAARFDEPEPAATTSKPWLASIFAAVNPVA
jgi:hypothetical protein